MLAFVNSQRTCHRRAFLRIGSLALGGLTLPGLPSTRTRAAQAGRPVTDRAVILLFLHGGPSQIETFDPKRGAPEGIRSATGEVATRLPGVTFGGSFPAWPPWPTGWPWCAPS